MKLILRLAMAMTTLLVFSGCDQNTKRTATLLTGGGNADKGREEIEYFGCASCHIVPGVAGANGSIGPSLAQIGNRAYIGGVVKNSPENLIRWIQNAPALSPRTAMPDLETPEKSAKDIACYLYTLK